MLFKRYTIWPIIWGRTRIKQIFVHVIDSHRSEYLKKRQILQTQK